MFTNPYQTSEMADQPLVVTGILLEYYSGGLLQQVRDETRMKEYPWENWAVQLGTAVLIDISGIGGVTYEWRSPEIRKEISPISLPFEVRKLNDTWVYGKLLLIIASHAEDGPFTETLKLMATGLMEDAQTRMTLDEAILLLKP